MKHFAAAALLGLLGLSAQAQTFCGTPVVESLVANGNITAGSITVGNDSTNVYVEITTSGDFTMSRADVAVATTLAGLPQSGGQPSLSQFPYRQTFSPEVTTYTFAIPLGTNAAGTTLLIAVHASLDSPTQGHQQAWASPGQLFPCSQACTQNNGCGDDHGDSTHLRASDGGGGDDCHGDRAASRHPVAIKVFDDGNGGQCQCGGGGDDHGDSQKVSPLWDNGGGSGGGDDSCGDDDHHDDHAHLRKAQDGNGGDGGGDGHGGDGGGDDQHSNGGSDCKAGCGATYFGFVIAGCSIIHE